MNVTSTNYTVADYCTAMGRKEIIVNRNYQRSDKVWPPAAKSFLIETILLNYPIPKLSLYQVTDIKSRKTYKEIVDGQQRSQAILDFYNDKFKLSNSSEIMEAAGKLYSELDPQEQHAFLDYSLSADVFKAATPDKIREVFRRINSYTIPLNAEEKRHAMYQGKFKWFIYKLSKNLDQNLFDIGVFTEKQLTRMADAKLFSEIIHAYLHGIQKTRSGTLDKLYENYDKEFPREQEIKTNIEQAIDLILNWKELHKGPLIKQYHIYALILAIIHLNNPLSNLIGIYQPAKSYKYNRDIVITNLSYLADALENPEDANEFKPFIDASSSYTNDPKNRKERFKWFCKALEPTLL